MDTRYSILFLLRPSCTALWPWGLDVASLIGSSCFYSASAGLELPWQDLAKAFSEVAQQMAGDMLNEDL